MLFHWHRWAELRTKLRAAFRSCFVEAPKSVICTIASILSVTSKIYWLVFSCKTQRHFMNLAFLNSSISFPTDGLSLPALYVFIFTQYAHKVNEVYISFMKPGPYPRSLLFNYSILIKSVLFVQEAWPGHSMIIYWNCHRRCYERISSQGKLLAHFPTRSPYLLSKYFLYAFFLSKTEPNWDRHFHVLNTFCTRDKKKPSSQITQVLVTGCQAAMTGVRFQIQAGNVPHHVKKKSHQLLLAPWLNMWSSIPSEGMKQFPLLL